MTLNIKQVQAYNKLAKLKAGALFMEPGMGKTKVALDLAISRQDDFDCIVWIAPASLINEDSYQTEIRKWSGTLIKPIHFYTVEGISMSDRLFLKMRSLAENYRTFCIVDESITIKNAEAGRTKRLLNMWSLFRFRLILNGTPLSKGLIDLYAQIQFIHPNILKMTEAQFANNFLTYKKDGCRPWQRWSRPSNEQALIEIIRPYIFDAELELDIGVNYHTHNCHLNSLEHEAYEEFKRSFLAKKPNLDFLAISQAFQQQYTLCQNKINLLKTIVSDNQQYVIFVKFLKEVSIIQEHFENVSIMTGERKDSLEEFKKNGKLLVATYGTGSLGLNLQFCHNAIFFSQTFDYILHKYQGLKRLWRTGQQFNVNCHDLWVQGVGLEKIMKLSQDKKQNTARNIRNFIGAHGAMAL